MLGILAVIWEWLIAVSLTFWIGILVIEAIAFNGERQGSAILIRARSQALPMQRLCLSALLGGEAILLIIRAAQFSQSLNGDTLNLPALGQLLFHSIYGFLWIAQIILILGSLGLLWWTAGRRQRPSAIWPLMLAGLILMAYALSENISQLSIGSVVLDWLALVAQGIWFGGLAYLGYILLPLPKMIEPDRSIGTLITFLLRYSTWMLAAIGVLCFSELYLTAIRLSNIGQLITEPYGRVLLVYWVLILMMLIASAYAFLVLRPKLARQAASLPPPTGAEIAEQQIRQSALDQTARGFRRLLSTQTWLGAVVLLCLAWATYFMSPLEFANTHSSRNTVAATPFATIQTKQVGNLSITLTVTPGKILVSNTVTVKITDTRSGHFVTNAHVAISMYMDQMESMGIARATVARGTPAYSATFSQDTLFSMAGAWDITLVIQLPQRVQYMVLFQVFLRGF